MTDNKLPLQIGQIAGLDRAERGAAIAMGNFDGVHKGHRKVIASAAQAADRLDAPLGVAVFHPHPRKFFQPSANPARLQSNAGRARELGRLGVKFLYAIPFDRSLSMMTDEEFAKTVLVDGFGIRHVSVGANYHFGRNRMGNAESLTRLGHEMGFSVDVVDLQGDDAFAFSSTRVREALKTGDCETAADILGRLWAIEARVEFGDQRGRTIGFPTANLELGEYLRPRSGVYAAFARVEGEGPWLPGVANIGHRPTVGGTQERLEIHLFDFAGDLYGRSLEVSLLHFLRDEKKFDGLDALKTQIGKDVETAKALTSDYLSMDRTGST